MMTRLAFAVFLFSFAFGGLPQSADVRARLARAGLVSSEQPETEVATTTTTLPPPATAGAVVELLASSGYPDVDAEALDRVVTLTGTIPDEASRRVIVRLVGDLPGVSHVLDETVVATPGSSGDVIVVGTTSQVTLAGAVADATTAAAVLEAVQAVYVADQIGGAVTVDAGAPVPARIAVTVESTRSEIGDQLRTAFETLDPTAATLDFRFRQLEIPRIESDLDDLLATDPIEFASGSSEIDEASAATLDDVATLLESFADAVIEVGGHTDDRGSDQANRQLSAQRAATVVAELKDRGVESELVPVGYGETRPRVVPSDTDDARAANRRIEFVLLTP